MLTVREMPWPFLITVDILDNGFFHTISLSNK